MSKSWPKVIRDPVHGIVPFEDTPCDRLLLNLINTKEMQRLRRIKQLGLSHLVFPGADHSRFAHSIGVMHMTRRFLDRVDRVLHVPITPIQKTAVLAASLLHDVGHGPFSHAFEKITGENHEHRTLEVIQDSTTEVNQRLREYTEVDLPKMLAAFFAEDAEENPADLPIPPFLTDIVSSQLDADRFDYLLRDSYASGTDYGRFDADWLLQNLFFNSDRGRFYLGYKAMLQAEQYVFARYHMYRSVYFHKTTRAAEVMLRLLFQRFKALLDAKNTDRSKHGIVPGAPHAVVLAFSQRMTLGEYLALDDHTMSEFLKACAGSKDKTLRELARGLLDRRLFKATDATGIVSTNVANFTEKAKEIIEEAGFDRDFAFADDAPGDIAYKLYNPESSNPATEIYVETHAGQQKELSIESDNVRQLTKGYTLVRFYYPEEVRDRIHQEAEPLLARSRP